jgi:hypothetical protein
MRIIQEHDPKICDRCATAFATGELAVDGIVYDIPVVVCTRRCLDALYDIWALQAWKSAAAWTHTWSL